MLTVFTIPKPFRGHTKIIQRNAIHAWKQLLAGCEIILMGDDEGVEEAAREVGARYVPAIGRNEFGTPLLSAAFAAAQASARHDTLMYANADVIFFRDLMDAVARIGERTFLACGRRWDLDIDTEIDFNDAGWAGKLHERATREGKLHGSSGLDYFIFPRNLVRMPTFAVGRPCWDNWLIYNMRSRGIPVIDATRAITVVHQNHDYSHSKFGGKQGVGGPEWRNNIKAAGGYMNMMTLRDADWVLDENGLGRPGFLGRIYPAISIWYPWRALLAARRKVRDRMEPYASNAGATL